MGRGGGEEKEPDGFGEIVGVKLGGGGGVGKVGVGVGGGGGGWGGGGGVRTYLNFLPSRGCVRGVVGVKVEAYITP